MIQFVNVSKKYGPDVTALENVNFQIERSEFVFLVGPTGSGKTTIFRLLQRDLLPTSGSILVDDWDLGKLPKGKVPFLRRKVGIVFQDLKLLMDRTVSENIMLPLQIAGISDDKARKKAEEILLDVGLVNKQNKFPLQLSGGERQRVAIARALIFEPQLILADEPTGNLDLETSLQILDLLESINNLRGTTIFMATHNSEIIDRTHKRVITMTKGAVKQDLKAKEKAHAHEKKE
jgi:cell division transport system ATP-binding protein